MSVFPPILSAHVKIVAATCPLGEAEKAAFLSQGFEMPVSLARAVSKRQEEFRSGRYCAKLALEGWGHAANAKLEILPDYAPAWPSGYVGSIAHSHDRAAAAVARALDLVSVGIDLEPVLSKVRAANVRRMILTVGDERAVSKLSSRSESERVSLVFTAKEAIYKCLRPLCGQYFGFEDADLDLIDDAAGTFAFHLNKKIGGPFEPGWSGHGRFAFEGGWIYTAVELAKI